MAQATKKMEGTVEKYHCKFGRRSQVTIPKEIVKELKMQEGDLLRVLRVGPTIVLVPVKTIPKGAVYFEPDSHKFITERDIKEAVSEAREEYKAGKLKFYDNVDDLFDDLGVNIGDE